MDISFAVLLQDLAEVRAAGGWSIVIDAQNRTYVHPRLTSPQFVNQDPNFIDVRDLESSATFASIVLPSMLASGIGSTRAVIEQVVSRGNAGEDGSETRQIEVSYYWRPLTGTGFFLAVVLPTASQSQGLYPGVPVDLNHIYHRIDLDDQGQKVETDTFRGNFLTNAADPNPIPGIKLAPFSHSEESVYTSRPETVENVTDFLTWARAPYSTANTLANARYSNPQKLHSDLQMLAQIKPCWNSARSDILYRYVGTESGSYYTIPASVYVPNYDPTVRPWYVRARLSSKLALSAPYRDAATNLIVVTLSKSLFDSGGRPFGVSGMDFQVQSIRSIFDGIVRCPSDSQCFLMDDAGFLLNSPLGARDDGNIVPQKWFGTYSPQLGQAAAGMLASGSMIKRFCLDFSDITRQGFYDVSDSAFQGTSSCGGVVYSVTPVPDSAFRLVVISSLTSNRVCCTNSCSTIASSTTCEAPCSSAIALADRCSSFTPSSPEQSFSSCPADPPVLRAQAVNGNPGLSTGAIIGIAVGAAVLAAVIIVVIVLVVVKKGKGRAHGAANNAAVQMSSSPTNDVNIAASAPPMSSLR